MSNPLRVGESAVARSVAPPSQPTVRLPGGMPVTGPEARALGRVLDDAASLTPAQYRPANAPDAPAARAGVDPGTLALDLTQIALDIVGIFEPTPFADGTNALISLGRGDFLGAGLSVLGVVPYIGDTAKLGKMGKWAQTVANAVELAASSPALARRLEPGLRAIKEAVDAIPQAALDRLPESAREAIGSMKSKLDDFFARGADDAAQAVAERPVIRIDGGRKGEWNTALNGKLTPNADYHVNGYVYRTDDAGRISEVSGQLDLTTADRNTYRQGRAGRQGIEGDEGGHIIASIFNGPGDMVNLYPQNATFNRGVWKQLENTWTDALREGKSVEVRIHLRYGDAGVRPERLIGNYSLDGGRPVEFNFRNRPGG